MSIYGIGIGEDFLSQIVAGFSTRYPDPLELAKIRIIANSSRSAANLETEFLKTCKISPKIQSLDQFVESERVWEKPPQAMSEIEQVLDVAKLISAAKIDFIGQEQNQIFELSYHLVELLNACAEREKTPQDLLSLELTQFSEHWKMNAELFAILLEYWQNHQNKISNVIKIAEIQKLAQKWQNYPPKIPHYIVASTGSRLQMREMMALILSQKHGGIIQGGIILPSFDFSPQKNLGEDHPQYGMQDLLNWLEERGFSRQVQNWSGDKKPIASFIHRAMAPPPYTQTWLNELDQTKTELEASKLQLTWIAAPTAYDEINALTMAIYHALSAGKSVELVSNDRVLVRRLLPRLDDLNIEYDDSAGRPIYLTPSAIFAALALDAFAQSETIRAMAFMEHPFTAHLKGRAEHLQNLRYYEKEILRGSMNSQAWHANLSEEKYENLREWADNWSHFFTQNLDTEKTLQNWLIWHLETLKWASGVTDKWSELGGQQYGDLDVFSAMEELANSTNYPHELSFLDYKALWQSWIARAGSNLTQQNKTAPVKILGKLELRAESADVVIFAAMNEGQWPSTTVPDMWLNREMRRSLELETPERFVGLSAHDFITGFSAKELILSRAVKAGDVPNIESRFLTRMRVLIKGADEAYLSDAMKRGNDWIKMGQELDRPSEHKSFSPRPSISLPPENRPTEYSATGIEALMRNPYRAYAERALGLRALKNLGGEFGPAEQGEVIHKAFELQSKSANTPPQNLDETTYFSTLETAITQYNLENLDRFDVEAIMQNLYPNYIEEENQRRAWAQTIQTENETKTTFKHENFTFSVTARFDRLDVNSNKIWRLYDYKPGASGPYSGKTISAENALQIPITALVLGQENGTNHDQIGVIRYKGQNAGSFAPIKEFSLEEFATEFAEFLSNYFDPNFGFAAGYTKNGYDQSYEHLSRFGEWLEGDQPENVEVRS